MRRWLGILAALMVTMTAGCYTCRPNCVAGICDCAPVDYAYHCCVYAGPDAVVGHDHGPVPHVPHVPSGAVKPMPRVTD